MDRKRKQDYLKRGDKYPLRTMTNSFMNINNSPHPLCQQYNTNWNPWVVFYTHIPQLMAHTTDAYIATANLAIMLLNLLAYC